MGNRLVRFDDRLFYKLYTLYSKCISPYHITKMFHLSQLQSSILLLSKILLYHIEMLIIFSYYTILKEIILFVN